MELRRLLLLGFLMGMVAFAYFVWPTRYEGTTVGAGEFSRPGRIDRFTRIVEVQDPGGRWRAIGGEEMLQRQVTSEQPSAHPSGPATGAGPAGSPELLHLRAGQARVQNDAAAGMSEGHRRVEQYEKDQEAMNKAVDDVYKQKQSLGQ